MKRLFFAAFVVGAFSATAVFAQPPQGGPRGPGRGPGGSDGPRPMPSPVIAALDTDRDGTISAEEIENSAKSLKTLDKNNDGKLTPEELRPPGGPEGGGFSPEAMLERVFAGDANGDGKLSKEEAPERMQANFERIDADGDGFVTKEEMQAAIARMQGGPRGPRDGEGGPRGPRDGEGGAPRGPRDGEGAPRGPRDGEPEN